MYLVVDATILISDKQFQQSLWKLLRSRPNSWDLKAIVPWPAFQEAVAHQVRFFDEHLSIARKLQSDTRRAGYHAPVEELVHFLDQAADRYSEELLGRLQEARVDVLDRLDEIDHREIVRRAVARRRPCDTKGDGYRDTLNWLHVLMLARDQPNEQIVWATADKDFRDQNGGAMHPHLLEDLDQVDTDARMRVSLALDYQEMLRFILGQYGKTDAELLPEATLERITELATQVLQGMEIDPIECGLPYSLRVDHGRIKVVTATRPLEIPGLHGETDVRPFTMEVSAECEAILSSRSDGSLEEPSRTTPKVLVVRGSVEFTNGAPVNVIIDEVGAVPGDPQLIQNRSFRDMVLAFARQSPDKDLDGRGAAAMISEVSGTRLSSTVAEMLTQFQQPSIKDSLAGAAAFMDQINRTPALDAVANAAAFMDRINRTPALDAVANAAAFMDRINRTPALDAVANAAAFMDRINRTPGFDATGNATAFMDKAMKPLLTDATNFMEKMHRQLYSPDVVADLVRRMGEPLVPKSVLDRVAEELNELDADEQEGGHTADPAVSDTESDPGGHEEERATGPDPD